MLISAYTNFYMIGLIMRYTIIFALLLLGSCASINPNQVDSKLSSWQGSNISTLIQVWGLPSTEREIQGMKYAEWNSKEVSNRPSINLGIGGFGSRIFGSIGTTLFGGRKESHCLVQVAYDSQGQVKSSNWKGDPDTCYDSIPEKE